MRAVVLITAVLCVVSAEYFNAAQGKNTSQSSVRSGGVSSRAVDGKVESSKWSSKSCIYTNSGEPAWWQVDLGEYKVVDHVIITARTDSRKDRVDGYTVYVGGQLCGTVKYDASTVYYTLQCGGLVGRLVKVQKSAEKVEKLGYFDHFQLCEVQVMVDKATDAPETTEQPGYGMAEIDGFVNVAQGKPTNQSDTPSWGRTSPDVVDGYALQKWNSKSCWSTNGKGALRWFEIDLGKVYWLDHIVIYGRGDSYQTLLEGAKVYIGKHLCGILSSPTKKATPQNISCQAEAMIGSKIRIEHLNQYIQLCEVRAMVRVDMMDSDADIQENITSTSDFSNVALGKATSQSSTSSKYYANKAVDGWIKHVLYEQGSCSSTNDNSPQWWGVELGQIRKVSHVILTLPLDSQERMNGVGVYVGPTLCGTVTYKYSEKKYDFNISCNGAVGESVVVKISNEGALAKGKFHKILLCEVQVMVARGDMKKKYTEEDVPEYDVSSDYVNVALNRPTNHSSTGWGGVSDRAVDGYTLQTWSRGSCTSTSSNRNTQWWAVELDQVYNIHHVVVYARTDRDQTTLNGAQVYIGNYHCGTISGLSKNVLSNNTISCGTAGVAGAKVTIKALKEHIQLCEVMVMVKKSQLETEHSTVEPEEIGPYVNVALNKNTSSSSVYSGGEPSRVVDGWVMRTEWNDGSCMHTYNRYPQWWSVDLAQIMKVDHVIVTARSDYKPERIDGMNVYVGWKLCGTISYKAKKYQYTVQCKGAEGRNVWLAMSPERVSKLGYFDYMQVCEVQVMVALGDMDKDISTTDEPSESFDMSGDSPYVNVAWLRPSNQSSTKSGREAQKANDGYILQDDGRGTCTCTMDTGHEYWEVTLEKTYKVHHVNIWGRTNGNWYTVGAKVYVGEQLCGVIPASKTNNVTITCPKMTGAGKVRIAHDKKYIILCEVEVMVLKTDLEKESPTFPPSELLSYVNVALKKNVSKSSGNDDAQRITDGYTELTTNSYRCCWTSDGYSNRVGIKQWVSVDLGKVYKVGFVRIIARSDERYTDYQDLNGARVYIGKRLIYTITTKNNKTDWTIDTRKKCSDGGCNGGTVSVKQATYSRLKLCEILAYVHKDSLSSIEQEEVSPTSQTQSSEVNVAYEKPVTQTSTLWEYYARKATDGYLNTFQHTNYEGTQRVSVDLKKVFPISYIILYMRNDSTLSRTSGLRIYAGEKLCRTLPYSTTISMYNITCNNNGSETYKASSVSFENDLQYVHIAEVEVWVTGGDYNLAGSKDLTADSPPEDKSRYKNVAGAGVASQSSTKHGGVASRGIDGFKLYTWNQKSCTHTDDDYPVEWWKVTLNKTYTVHKVNIFGRTDSSMDRLDGAVITVNGTTVGAIRYKKGDTNWTIAAHDVKGGEVKVTLADSEVVTVCEVQVMVLKTDDGEDSSSVTPVPTPKHLASNKVASMSRALYSDAQAAVDGNTEANFFRGSCIQTAPAQQPWWSVDLEKSKKIGKVRVYPRLDAYTEKTIAGAQVFAGSNLCGGITYVPDVQYYEIDCQGLSASQLKITKLGWLSFCEVMVFESQ